MEQRESFLMLLTVAVLILLTGLMFIARQKDDNKTSYALEDVAVVSDSDTTETDPQVEIADSVRRALVSNNVKTASSSETSEIETLAALLRGEDITEDRNESVPENDLSEIIITPGHVLGEPDAEIVLTTYADLDGPFNKTFHETLKEIKQEYGDDKVAIVYKHFPLEQLYPDSPILAEASECVAEQNELAFWVFINLIFTERDISTRTDIAELPTYVKNMGLNVPQYEACMQSGRYKVLVEAQVNEAIALGAQGTPYTTISIAGIEEVGVLNGAQPVEQVRKTLDDLIF